MAAKQSAHCSHTVQRGKKHRRQQKNTFLPFPPNLCLSCGVVLLVLQLLFIFGCGSRQFVLYYAHILCIYANLRPTRIAFYGGLVFNLSTQSQNAYCGYEHRRKSHFTNERACVWLVCVCALFLVFTFIRLIGSLLLYPALQPTPLPTRLSHQPLSMFTYFNMCVYKC